MDNIKGRGIIKAMSPIGQGYEPDFNSVLIQSDLFSSHKDSARWFNLAEDVLPAYIKRGEVHEFEIDENNLVVFAKALGGFRPAKASTPYPASNPSRDENIETQWAINAAREFIRDHNTLMLTMGKHEQVIEPTLDKIKEFALAHLDVRDEIVSHE